MLGREFGQRWEEEGVSLYRIMLSGWAPFNPYRSLKFIRGINSKTEMDCERSTCRRDKRQLGSRNHTWMDNIKMVPI